MSVMSIIIEYIGIPNDPIGWTIAITVASITFLVLLEGLMYMIWKSSTVSIG